VSDWASSQTRECFARCPQTSAFRISKRESVQDLPRLKLGIRDDPLVEDRRHDGREDDVPAKVIERERDLSGERGDEGHVKKQHSHSNARDRVVDNGRDDGEADIVCDAALSRFKEYARECAERRVRSGGDERPCAECAGQQVKDQDGGKAKEHPGQPAPLF